MQWRALVEVLRSPDDLFLAEILPEDALGQSEKPLHGLKSHN